MARVLAVGTNKGLFLYQNAGDGWKLSQPALAGWEVSAVLLQGPRILAGTVAWSYGATIRESKDGGATWTLLEGRPGFPEGSDRKLNRIWQLAEAGQPHTLYAGIDEAALFISRDDAQSWTELDSLTNVPNRAQWMPGAGGLCLHTIIVDHANPNRLWVGISAVGCFRSDDGGKTWALKVTGIKPIDGAPDTAWCIHKIVQHPTQPDTLYMQFHGGVYRSTNAGDRWDAIETGLPSNFGFPLAITPRGTLLLAPLVSGEQRMFPKGRFAIYRSTDNGDTWTATTQGLPADPNFNGILRDAMTCTADGTLFFGTTNGEVWTSADDGVSWHQLPGQLPRVLVVRGE